MPSHTDVVSAMRQTGQCLIWDEYNGESILVPLLLVRPLQSINPQAVTEHSSLNAITKIGHPKTWRAQSFGMLSSVIH